MGLRTKKGLARGQVRAEQCSNGLLAGDFQGWQGANPVVMQSDSDRGANQGRKNQNRWQECQKDLESECQEGREGEVEVTNGYA